MGLMWSITPMPVLKVHLYQLGRSPTLQLNMINWGTGIKLGMALQGKPLPLLLFYWLERKLKKAICNLICLLFVLLSFDCLIDCLNH